MHPEPVTSIDQRRPADRLLDKELEEVWFVYVESLDAPLADDAAIVRL